MKRLTRLELEAVKEVVIERLSGDAEGFFRDACGKTERQAGKLAAALKRALEKL